MRIPFGAAAIWAALFFAGLGPSFPAFAQERAAAKAGFVIPRDRSVRILLIRPSISVGAQSTGGMFEPNADWTEQARANISGALMTAQKTIGHDVVLIDEPIGAPAQVLADYRALFSVVADAVRLYKFFPGNRLPTKKREGVFDWSLGPGVAAVAAGDGADYALFIETEDHYGSTGRKALQLFAAMAGVGITAGVHKGYAGLVDLKSGDLVWLNADLEMGGDVRSPDGAQKRVAQLLEDFPTAPVAGAVK